MAPPRALAFSWLSASLAQKNMSLSKHHLDSIDRPVCFQPDALADDLRATLPEVVFALLHGSARDGVVPPHADLDLAIYLTAPARASLELFNRITTACIPHVGQIRCDVGILNHAESVFRFEALKGRLLFARDQEAWLRFYSITCREYEHQLFDYERQLRYRLEAVS